MKKFFQRFVSFLPFSLRIPAFSKVLCYFQDCVSGESPKEPSNKEQIFCHPAGFCSGSEDAVSGMQVRGFQNGESQVGGLLQYQF